MAKKETFWPCPQPPPPGMLCLGLTARAHATDYFLANYFLRLSPPLLALGELSGVEGGVSFLALCTAPSHTHSRAGATQT